MTLLEIAQNVPAHLHPVWDNAFFYLFMTAIIVLSGIIMAIMKALKKRDKASELQQQQHVARVDIIRKEQQEKLECLRVEMLKREEERTRQWMESEKETLHVLNGVSNLLDLTDKIGHVDSDKIMLKLDEIDAKVNKIREVINKNHPDDKNGGTQGS